MAHASPDDLTKQRCRSCEGRGIPPMTAMQARQYLAQLQGWELLPDVKTIRKAVAFKNFMDNINAVNQIARLAEEEHHHPDLAIAFRRLTITLSTHAVGGLSDNDFILAAKIDRLLRPLVPDS